MRVVRKIGAARELAGCVLVPTMGALHEGHLSLVRIAAARGGTVVVSVFVNPTQFAEGEDLDRYPRDLDGDVVLAASAGADVVFAPEPHDVYPAGVKVPVPPLPPVAREPGLEDRVRPGHFGGVCQVVSRLFDIVRPRTAVFGEKDYQQLLVLRAMVAADAGRRWGDLELVAGPTVREPDGLAMSSRNRSIAPEDRDRALGLVRGLRAAQGQVRPDAAERAMRDELASRDLAIDYAVVRDATTLMPIAALERPARALVAARVDDVRLIDNMAMVAAS